MPAVAARRGNPFAGQIEINRGRSVPKHRTTPPTSNSPTPTPRRTTPGPAAAAATPRPKTAPRARTAAPSRSDTAPPGTLTTRQASSPRMRATTASSFASAADAAGASDAHGSGQGPLPTFGRSPSSPRQAWGNVAQDDFGTDAPPGSFGGALASRGRPAQRSALGGGAALSSGKANPLDYVQSHIRNRQTTPEITSRRQVDQRRDSQLEYADKSQTLIFFDWDDTLFPTTYLLHTLKLMPDVPLSRQLRLTAKQRDEIAKRVAQCEMYALKILQQGQTCGQVVVLTAAGQHGWVDRACNWCYPEVGKTLKMLRIQIVYAQDPVRKQKAQLTAKTPEQFWGLVKGLALHEEISKFYSRYEGQSWKNVLSIGDSTFERYGLLAASTAYMQGRRLSGMELRGTFQPMQESAWQKVRGDGDNRIARLRVKCCKFVGCPDVQELAVELDLMCKWLSLIVKFDRGLDLNFEDLEGEKQVAVVEAVLKGRRPVEQLPRAAIIGSNAYS
eukprot:TRINITY_DN24659_c0_g6_i1.p1 TRINITY_DN24659_c0_g6~~TRINITY_DN24659_c0_g6_i1.p1  ORF type:complete len:502 (+),score=99.60 TRINITY_DN24659_c0_g6_i1:115-1620(+)